MVKPENSLLPERNDQGSPGLEPSQLGVYLVHQLPFGVKTIPQNQNLLMMGFPEKGTF